MKINLTSKQQEIVNHTDGALLVEAGPGSGKTMVLVERIKKLLLIQKRCKILALTFSNLAAEEMKSRLHGDKTIEDYIDNVNFGTIHSFCLDLVQKRRNLIGLNNDLILFENIVDRQAALGDVFQNNAELFCLLNEQINPGNFLTEYLNKISDCKKKFISPEICEYDYPFSIIYDEYNQYLRRQNVIDFDDILFYAYRILTENPGVVKLYTSLYKYICVDEAQDLNFAQYEVIKALCGNDYKNIMFVGDENQSIYGFNGSDSKFMSQNFIKDFTPTIFSLNENFRSSKEIVKYANQIKESDNTSNYFYDGELEIFSFMDELKEADFITRRINELFKYGHEDIKENLDYNDFAIIARNKYIFKEIELSFQKNNIPFFYKKVISGIDNESDYMKIFELSMRMLINPKDIIHFRELCKLLEIIAIDNDSYNNGLDLLKQILSGSNGKYRKILDALSVLDTENFEFSNSLKLLNDFESDSIYMSDEEKYLIYGDIKQWENHWKKYIAQVKREYRNLISFRNNISLGKTQDISSDKGIALLTAHMSKGLQFEVVFIIGLTEGTFPDYRALNSQERMEQETNNMYVAVTRAKRLCYLTYSKKKQMPWGGIKEQEKSRFIQNTKLKNVMV